MTPWLDGPPDLPAIARPICSGSNGKLSSLNGLQLEPAGADRDLPIPGAWLRQFTDAPIEQLAFARGKGDSMAPTIGDGDLCLVDLSRRKLDEQDGLWAIAFGDMGAIKRLRRLPDGSIKIISDNEKVGVEVTTVERLQLLGRVCAVVRKP